MENVLKVLREYEDLLSSIKIEDDECVLFFNHTLRMGSDLVSVESSGLAQFYITSDMFRFDESMFDDNIFLFEDCYSFIYHVSSEESVIVIKRELLKKPLYMNIKLQTCTADPRYVSVRLCTYGIPDVKNLAYVLSATLYLTMNETDDSLELALFYKNRDDRMTSHHYGFHFPQVLREGEGNGYRVHPEDDRMTVCVPSTWVTLRSFM